MNKIFKVTQKVYEMDFHAHKLPDDCGWDNTEETDLTFLKDVKTIALCKTRETATGVLYDYLMETLKREREREWERFWSKRLKSDKLNFMPNPHFDICISLLEKEKEEFLSKPLETIAKIQSEDFFFDDSEFLIEEVYTDLI